MYSKFDTLKDVLANVSVNEDKGIYFSHHRNDDVFLSYKQLSCEAHLIAGAWQQQGVKANDKIVFQLEDNKNFVVAFWAAVVGNFIPVPVSSGNSEAHSKKLSAIYDVLQTSWTVSDNHHALDSDFSETGSKLLKIELEDKIVQPELAVPTSTNEELAFIQFSSGSTGQPKGVMLTHQNIITNNIATIEATKSTESDITFSWMPLTHDMGLIGFHINPMMVGCDQYIMPTASFIRDPLSWISRVSQSKATVLSSPNFGYHHFLKRFESTKKTLDLDLKHVRLIFNGAEPINAQLSQDFVASLKQANLQDNVMFPVYGLAEATLGVTFPEAGEALETIVVDRTSLSIGSKATRTQEGVTFVALGKPIPEIELKITNQGVQCDDLTIGEVIIRGKSVTRGYYNAQDKTNDLISPEGWLATGDLGFIDNEKLYITGRVKDLIIVNGQNIYPHDIEQTLSSHPSTPLGSTAVVAADTGGKSSFSVFVQYRGALESFLKVKSSIENTLSSQHGIFPGSVVPIKLIPKTTSGKVQRFQLKQRLDNGDFDDVISEINQILTCDSDKTPLSKTEQYLSTLWQEILRCSPPKKTDNFFAKGGNSLDAVLLYQKVAATLNIEISLPSFHSCVTLESMASAIDSVKDDSSVSNRLPITTRTEYPLTSAQLSMFALCQRDTHTAYNVTAAISVDSTISQLVLKASSRLLLSKHKRLFSSMVHLNQGVPHWVCDDNNLQHICTEQITFDDNASIASQLENVAQEFNVLENPLVRLKFGYHRDKTILLIDCHHLLCDGLSIPVLFDEWTTFIEREQNLQSENLDADNPELRKPDAFDCYLASSSSISDSKLNFWKSRIASLPTDLKWPLQNARPAKQDFRGVAVTSTLNDEDTRVLENISATYGTSSQSLLQTLFQIWVSKHCGQTRFSLAIPVTLRDYSSISLPGMFAESLLLESDIDYSDSLKGNMLKLQSHINCRHEQMVPFSQLAGLEEVKPSQSRNPLFDLMFVYQPIPKQYINDGYDYIPFHNLGSKVDLTLFAQHEANKRTEFILEGSRSLFSRESLEKMLDEFMSFIEGLVAQPDKPLNKCFSSAHTVYPVSQNVTHYDENNAISKWFDDATRTHPDKVALTDIHHRWTYKELSQKSHQVTNALVNAGITRGHVVAVISSATKELLPLLIGINRLGACYVPIDDNLPTLRKNKILNAASPALVVCGELREPTAQLGSDLVCPTIDFKELIDGAAFVQKIKGEAKPNDLAYIIFTSGSTGEPKGVTVTNKGLTNYLEFAKDYNDEQPMNMALFTSISFDLTVTTLFGPICSGGNLHVLPQQSLIEQLSEVLSNTSINTLKITPAHLEVLTTLAEQISEKTQHLSCFIVGGEQLSTALARRAQIIFPNAKIINEYGPTETVVGCITHRYSAQDDKSHAVPIGKAANNVSIYLLDSSGNQVEPGSSGEIWIGGDGVSPGYFNDEERTAKAFVTPDFIADGKLYRTGDIAYQNDQNDLVYVGREGSQIQLRGYRVETEEVESTILKLDGVTNASVAVIEIAGTTQLVAFYAAANEVADILQVLAKELPDYMVPLIAIRLDALPLTVNGKIDSSELELIAKNYTHEQNCSLTDYDLSPSQIALQSAWEHVLNQPVSSIDRDFFHAGGDSIKALQIVAHLRGQGWSIDTRDILLHSTFESMASKLSVAEPSQSYSQETLDGKVAPTPAMNWFFQQSFIAPSHYHQSVLLNVSDSLSTEVLETGLKQLLVHHDALRLRFEGENASYQGDEITDDFFLEIEPSSAAKPILDRAREAKSSISFNDSLLFRAVYFEGSQPKLLLVAHHLTVDGVSWRILLDDLATLLTASEQGQPLSLPLKSACLHDYQECLESASQETLRSEKQYWLDHSVDPLDLSLTKNDQRANTAGPSTFTVKLDEPDNEVNAVFNTQLQDILLASLALALEPLTTQKQFNIEVESHGRELDNIDLSRTVGWFTTIYPVLFTDITNVDTVIRNAKEGTRSVPRCGVGYLLNHEVSLATSKPACRFNYLGNLAIDERSHHFSLCSDHSGENSDDRNGTTASFECDCWSDKDGLILQVKTAHTHATLSGDSLLNRWKEQFEEVVLRLKQASDIQFTPSDFSDADLSQEDLDALF